LKVNNECLFPVIALCVHKDHGFEQQEVIDINESKEVVGPLIGEMGGKRCKLTATGEITCHEKPDDDSGFQVLDGQPLILIVRHHLNSLPTSS